MEHEVPVFWSPRLSKRAVGRLFEDTQLADAPFSFARVLGRALFGGLVMATALGVGTTVGSALTDSAGLDGFPGRLVPAALVSAIAVPLVAFAACSDRRRAEWLGYGGARASARALLTGVAVTATAAALVLSAGTAAGMMRWSSPDIVTLGWFLVSNAVVAFLLEAWPEETTLRGYTWASLRGQLGGAGAAFGTTMVFLLVPGASTVAGSATAHLIGVKADPIGIAPNGQNPADYAILLVVFGLTLVAARTALRQASLWTSIGTHVTFLTASRILLDGDRRDTGWPVDTTPSASLLVPAFLLLALAGFTVCRRVGRRGLGPRLDVAQPDRTGFAPLHGREPSEGDGRL
ncbi:type II CAAX prenyl endopeptidase Rce1 family protein [Actinomadura verrucosospora]